MFETTLTGLAFGGVASTVVAVHDYENNPECILPAHPCGGKSGFDCNIGCPGPDIHWATIVSVGIAMAICVWIFIALIAPSKPQASD